MGATLVTMLLAHSAIAQSRHNAVFFDQGTGTAQRTAPEWGQSVGSPFQAAEQKTSNEFLNQEYFGQNSMDDDSQLSYGADMTEPRGTLFQWSYGTSFSGGPDLDSPLVTDRPDFTEAASTVGRGVAQIEFGYTYTSDDDGATFDSHSYPETLLRYGILADWLELRIAWNYVNEQVGSVDTSGSEDLYLGFKIGLTPQEALLPEMALIPQMMITSWEPVCRFGSNSRSASRR